MFDAQLFACSEGLSRNDKTNTTRNAIRWSKAAWKAPRPRQVHPDERYGLQSCRTRPAASENVIAAWAFVDDMQKDLDSHETTVRAAEPDTVIANQTAKSKSAASLKITDKMSAAQVKAAAQSTARGTLTKKKERKTTSILVFFHFFFVTGIVAKSAVAKPVAKAVVKPKGMPAAVTPITPPPPSHVAPAPNELPEPRLAVAEPPATPKPTPSRKPSTMSQVALYIIDPKNDHRFKNRSINDGSIRPKMLTQRSFEPLFESSFDLSIAPPNPL